MNHLTNLNIKWNWNSLLNIMCAGSSVSPLPGILVWKGGGIGKPNEWGLPFAMCEKLCGISETPGMSSSSSSIWSSFAKLLTCLLGLDIWRIWCTIVSIGDSSCAIWAAVAPDALMAATLRLVSHLRSAHFLMTSIISRWHSLTSLIHAATSPHVRFFRSFEMPRLNFPVKIVSSFN